MHENGLLFCFLLYCDLRNAGSHRACLSQAGMGCTNVRSVNLKLSRRCCGATTKKTTRSMCSDTWCRICWILLHETI